MQLPVKGIVVMVRKSLAVECVYLGGIQGRQKEARRKKRGRGVCWAVLPCVLAESPFASTFYSAFNWAFPPLAIAESRDWLFLLDGNPVFQSVQGVLS